METRQYETIVILDHTTGEAACKAEAKKLEKIFEQHGAVELATDHWGRREIPMMAGKFAHGYFVCYKYRSASETTVHGIEGLLRITDSVEKFQTHRLGDPKRKFKGNPKAARPGGFDDALEGAEADF